MWNDISELVIKAQAGDNEAMGSIYIRCAGYVYKRARHMLRSDQDAQDATQAVFVEILNSLHSLKEPSSFQGWLNKIILYKCYRYYESAEYKHSPVSLGEVSGEEIELQDGEQEAMPLPVLEKAETKEALQAIIDSLPAEQKDTIIMYYFYQCKVGEIAEIMDCPPGTVKSRLNYARKEIRRQIEEKRKKGIVFPAFVPLPIIALLIEEALEQVDVPVTTVDKIGQALRTKFAPVAVDTAVKSTMTGLTKIIIGVTAGVLVTVGVVSFNQNEEPSADGEIIQQEESIESMQPVQTAAEVALPVTGSDYARIYYDYVQDELKPNGLWGNAFYDAEMSDMNSDGTPELLAMFSNEMVVIYRAVADGDNVMVEQLYTPTVSYVSEDDTVEGSVGSAMYLIQYEGVNYIARYTTYAFIEDSNGLEIARHQISLYEAKETVDMSLYSFHYYVNQDDGVSVSGQIHTLNASGESETVSLSDSETRGLYAELIVPASAWGMVVGNNNAGFDFADTGGERLRDYFED